MAFNKRPSNTETCQLLQHPIVPPRRCMVTEYLPPGGLLLGMAKPPTQQKTSFHLISFLDATLGIDLLILPRQVTPAAWTKANLQRTLQTMPTPAPAPGNSPLVPTLLAQKDTNQLKFRFKGSICSCLTYSPEPHL
ncbi:hypothetical protein LEMLEM_LOCUS16502 [Lemmus lemmus]